MNTSDRDRGSTGLVCCVVEQADGKIRLVLDDVVCVNASDPLTWTTEALYTWREYDRASFLASELSEQQLADIGLSIVVRLAALAQRAHDPTSKPKE